MRQNQAADLAEALLPLQVVICHANMLLSSPQGEQSSYPCVRQQSMVLHGLAAEDKCASF